MTSSEKEEYLKRYSSLYNLINNAYMDKYLLEEIHKFSIEIYHNKNEVDSRVISVINHFCELIKKDLCLTIWKIYCDENQKANTLKALGRHLSSITKKLYDTSLPKELRKHTTTITRLRSKWLAHNDINSANSTIQIQDLCAILDNLRAIFNSLCDINVCSSVAPLSDLNLLPLKLNSISGLSEMLYRDNQPIGYLTYTNGNKRDEDK